MNIQAIARLSKQLCMQSDEPPMHSYQLGSNGGYRRDACSH